MASRAFLASRDYLSLDKSKLEEICRTILANSVLILKVEGVFAAFPQWITFLREFSLRKFLWKMGKRVKALKSYFGQNLRFFF